MTVFSADAPCACFLPFDLAPIPRILAYLQRSRPARDAYQRAMRKGDPDMAPLLT